MASMTNQKLLDYVNSQAKAGWSGASMIQFLSQLGYTKQSFVSQLRNAGLSSTQANGVANGQGSELKSILSQIGSSAIAIPGSTAGLGALAGDGAAEKAGLTAAAGAEAGAAGAGAGSTAATAAGTLAAGAGLADVWNAATGDAKYAAVMVGVLILGALMIFRAFAGGSPRPAVVPV